MSHAINLKKIPVTIISGFLGSGKTTLIQNLLRNMPERKFAIVINEFGELDIDANLLRGENHCENPEENCIYELANGCICCTVAEEFLPMMQKLLKRRDTIDHIIIETSGLALPKPLVQAFKWPEISRYCTIDAVITLIDAPAIKNGFVAQDESAVVEQCRQDAALNHDVVLQDLLLDQLMSADLVILSKTDQLTDDAILRLKEALVPLINQKVTILSAINGQLPSSILDLHFSSQDYVDQIETKHDQYHADDKAHRHAHEYFDQVVFTGERIDTLALLPLIAQLQADYSISRVKGFVHNGKAMRQVLQVVGQRQDCYFDRLWAHNEKRQTKLVFIGQNLDKNTICSRLESLQIA